MILNERVRRLITLTLFLLLGPSPLFLIGYKLYERNSSKSLTREAEIISNLVDYDVVIEGREFLRPGAQRLLQVSFISNDQRKVVYCPEIYLIKENDSDFIGNLARSFRTRQEDPDAQSTDSSRKLVATREYDRLSAREKLILAEPMKSLEEVVFNQDNVDNIDVDNQRVHNYSLIVIPYVYCCEDNILEIKSKIINLIQKHKSALNFKKKVFGLAVGEIIVEKTNEDLERRFASIPQTDKKTNRELASFFFTTNAEQADASNRRFDDNLARLRAYESENTIVKGTRAVFVLSSDYNRIEVLYELNKISDPNVSSPYRFAYESFNNRGVARFVYDSQGTITPVSFAATFFPFFQNLGSECWFTGKIRVDSFITENSYVKAQTYKTTQNEAEVFADAREGELNNAIPQKTISVRNFQLHNCDLEKLKSSSQFPITSGIITNLSITQGIIICGAFEGEGSINIKNGSLPTQILQNLTRDDFLIVTPNNILNYKFANDAIPFNEFETLFHMTEYGVSLDSSYDSKIIACYEKGNARYGLFLNAQRADQIVPYVKALQSILGSNSEEELVRSPLFKYIVNYPARATQPIYDANVRNATAR